MTSFRMHYTDNANSWSRMLMLARLYFPAIKRGLIMYATIPLLLVVVTALIGSFTGSIVSSIPRWVYFAMLYMSPLMITRRDYRQISAQLPVTAIEKSGFLVIMFMVVCPALLIISSLIGELVSVAIFGDNAVLLFSDWKTELFRSQIPTSLYIISSYIISCAVIAIEIYYIVTAKNNRVLAAWVSVLVAYVCLVFISSFFGIAAGINTALSLNVEASEAAIDAALTNAIPQYMRWAYNFNTILCVIVGSIYLVKLYKRLRNSGF